MQTGRLPLLPWNALRAQVSSAVRPYTRTASGRARVLYNDVSEALGRDKRVAEPCWEQWARVLRNSADALSRLPPVSSPRVLLASAALPWDELKLVIESTLAAALRLRGADVGVLICERTLPACEVTPWGNYAPPPGEGGPDFHGFEKSESCRHCTHQLNRLFAPLPVRRVSLREHAAPERMAAFERQVSRLSPSEFREFSYAGINVGEFAHASMLRVTLRGTLEDDARTELMYRRYLVSILYLVDVLERLFDSEKPERVVVCDGVYAMMGTLTQFAERRGVPAFVWGLPLRKQTLWLSRGDSVYRQLLAEPPSVIDEFSFGPERERLVDEYLGEKRLGGKDYIAYHTQAVEDQRAIRSELGILDDRPVIALYTNVLWDAQIFYNGTAFAGMLEWLFETIRFYAGRPGEVLVIRVHPAESKGVTPSRQPIADEIHKAFPALPENVKVVLPESKISSYALAELAQAALIYGARMGWEIAALGTPLLVAGEAFSRDKGFSFDAKSRDEYFSLLERAPSLPKNSALVRQKAKRYGYHFLYRRMLDMPVLSSSIKRPELLFDDLDALAEGRVPQLDLICRGIIEGATSFVWDGPP
jgi:hypothetical protein